MTVVAVIFWLSVALLIYAQVGYGLVLGVLVRVLAPGGAETPRWSGDLPRVSVIVAAYREQEVIAARVANLRALDYPPEQLEVVIAVDGGADPETDATVERAAGADHVLALPRGGKVAAQNAAAAVAGGEILAFSDANSSWRPDALRRLVDGFADPRVGYVCGDVSFSAEGGSTNQEGLYWRYEMFLRRQESALASVTAGNGAIYATRAAAYLVLAPIMSHDLCFPFKFVKRGWRAIYAPAAQATEKMAPSLVAEFTRKRRMASRAWPCVVLGGMLSPRGYGPLYALMLFSHRILRYSSPLIHLAALAANVLLLGRSPVYVVTFALQMALIAAALIAPLVPLKLLWVARYYVWTTASLAVGLWDWLTGPQVVMWEPVEGTR